MKKKISVPAGTRHFSQNEEMPVELSKKLEKMAYEHGRYFDSYIITEPNRHYFWSEKDLGVVGFHITGRYINIASGLIAHPANKSGLIKNFIQFAEKNGFVLSFFSLDQEDADALQSHGFQVTKYGEETTIHLKDWSWSGKKFEWVRRQSNYVKRQDVVYQEVSQETLTEEEWSEIIEELEHISEEHLSTKPQKEAIPLFEGRLLRDHLHRRRVFIAKNMKPESGERIEGFILCNPYNNGKNWGVEMYRQRKDAVRGTIPFLIFNAINQLQDEEHQTVSLCPIPALRCETPLEDDSKEIRTILSLWYNRLNFLFDVEGLYHFKSRFRPEFNDMFVCVYPKASVFSIMGYMRCIKLASVRKSFLIKLFYKRLTQRKILARVAKKPQTVSIPLAQKSVNNSGNKSKSKAG